MSFAEHCQHCTHYHDEHGKCCYCEKEYTDLSKTAAEHRRELQEIVSD